MYAFDKLIQTYRVFASEMQRPKQFILREVFFQLQQKGLHIFIKPNLDSATFFIYIWFFYPTQKRFFIFIKLYPYAFICNFLYSGLYVLIVLSALIVNAADLTKLYNAKFI